MLFLHASYLYRAPPGPRPDDGERIGCVRDPHIDRGDDTETPLYLVRIEQRTDLSGTHSRQRVLAHVPYLQSPSWSARLGHSLHANRDLFPVRRALRTGAAWLNVGVVLCAGVGLLVDGSLTPAPWCVASGLALGATVGTLQYLHLRRGEDAEMGLAALCDLLYRVARTDDPHQAALLSVHADQQQARLQPHCASIRAVASRMTVAVHSWGRAILRDRQQEARSAALGRASAHEHDVPSAWSAYSPGPTAPAPP